MSVLTDVELADLIVSIANAVVEANDLLNENPDAGLAITEFTADVSLIASLRTPGSVSQPRFQLEPSASGTFKVAPAAPRLRAARFSQVLTPSVAEMVLPSVHSQTSKVEIHAVISAAPSTTTA